MHCSKSLPSADNLDCFWNKIGLQVEPSVLHYTTSQNVKKFTSKCLNEYKTLKIDKLENISSVFKVRQPITLSHLWLLKSLVSYFFVFCGFSFLNFYFILGQLFEFFSVLLLLFSNLTFGGCL